MQCRRLGYLSAPGVTERACGRRLSV